MFYEFKTLFFLNYKKSVDSLYMIKNDGFVVYLLYSPGGRSRRHLKYAHRISCKWYNGFLKLCLQYSLYS